MTAASSPPTHDAEARRESRRRRTMSQGGWWGLGTMGVALPYALIEGGPHPALLIALATGGILMSVAVALSARWSQTMLRHRRAVMLAYTVAHIVITAACAAADGGAGSPMALGFFGTFVFAAYTVPLGLLPVFGALNVAAYLSVDAVAGGARPGYVWVELVGMLATGAACAHQHHQLVSQRRAFFDLARTDPLTGALNRRGFQERLEAALADARPVVLFMLDLDDFKAINDRGGHAAGDERLVSTARLLHATLGAGAQVGRIGGDEFAALLDGPGVDAPAIIDELERAATASVGFARLDAGAVDAAALLAIADRRLYLRKAARRSAPARPVARPVDGVAARAA